VDRERCNNGIPFLQAPGEGRRQIKVPAVSGEPILCEVEALRTVKHTPTGESRLEVSMCGKPLATPRVAGKPARALFRPGAGYVPVHG
jgi:hypothetical protein